MNYLRVTAQEVGQTKSLFLISIPWFFSSFPPVSWDFGRFARCRFNAPFLNIETTWMPKTLKYTQAPFDLIQESINKDFRRRSRVEEGNSNERHKEDWGEES